MSGNIDRIIQNLERDLQDLKNELEKTKVPSGLKGNQKNEFEDIENDFKIATGLF